MSTDPRGPRAARISPLSPARLNFTRHCMPSSRYPFLSFSFRIHPISIIGHLCSFCSYVSSSLSRAPVSPLLRISHVALTRLLIPFFPRFPSRPPFTNFRAICRSVSSPYLGVPIFGDVIVRGSALPALTLTGGAIRILRAARYLIHMANCANEKTRCSKYCAEISPSRFNDTCAAILMINTLIYDT